MVISQKLFFALDAQDHLVGVDQTPTWPSQAQDLPQIGDVRRLSAEGILSLDPDLLITAHDAGPDLVQQQLQQAGAWLFRPLLRPARGGSSEMAAPMGFCASARGELRLCCRADETVIPMNQATITTAGAVAVARSRQHWQRKPDFIWFQ